LHSNEKHLRQNQQQNWPKNANKSGVAGGRIQWIFGQDEWFLVAFLGPALSAVF